MCKYEQSVEREREREFMTYNATKWDVSRNARTEQENTFVGCHFVINETATKRTSLTIASKYLDFSSFYNAYGFFKFF